MATFKGPGKPQRGPSLTGRISFYTWRGQLVARAWRKPMSEATKRKTADAREWFRQANLASKYTAAEEQAWSRAITRGGPFLPRDAIMAALAGRMYTHVITPSGVKYSMALRQDISEALDAITQQKGAMLIRGPNGWGALPEPPPGHILMSMGPNQAPAWVPIAEAGLIPEAPGDGKQYGRQNKMWTEVQAGPAPAPAGHPRWRLLMTPETTAPSGLAAFTEIEFRMVPGATETAADGAVIHSAGIANPAKAFNGVISGSDYAHKFSPYDGEWLGYNYPDARDVREVMYNSPLAGYTPSHFIIQSSPDGIEWTDRLHVANLTGAGTHVFEIAPL